MFDHGGLAAAGGSGQPGPARRGHLEVQTGDHRTVRLIADIGTAEGDGSRRPAAAPTAEAAAVVRRLQVRLPAGRAEVRDDPVGHGRQRSPVPHGRRTGHERFDQRELHEHEDGGEVRREATRAHEDAQRGGTACGDDHGRRRTRCRGGAPRRDSNGFPPGTGLGERRLLTPFTRRSGAARSRSETRSRPCARSRTAAVPAARSRRTATVGCDDEGRGDGQDLPPEGGGVHQGRGEERGGTCQHRGDEGQQGAR